MNLNSFIVTFALIFAISAAPASSPPLTKAIIPSKDPFYQPDSGYQNQPLGTILRSRQVIDGIGLIVFKTNIKAAYQLLVRSQDSFGNATAIVTTVIVPWNADPNKILSYQTAEDSSDVDCAPSYAIQLSSSPLSWAITEFEQIFANTGLYEGWYVVIPDHLGPKSAFGVGLQAGYAALDSLKAVTQSGSFTGVSSNPRIALWGYSGGSQPTTWGAALAPTYAPDLNIVGAAAGGVTTSWKDILNANSGKLFGFLDPSILTGFGNEYPVFNQYLKDNLYPSVQSKFFNATKQCELVQAIKNAFISWDKLSPKGAALIDDPTISKILDDNDINNLNATPKAPIFMYSATYDEIVPAGGEEDLYNKWCGSGATVTYRKDLLSEHVIQYIAGAGDAFIFVKDRLNGVEIKSGCQQIDSLSNFLNENSVLGLATIVLDLAKLVEHAPTGPSNSSNSSGLPATIQSSDLVQTSTGISVPGLSGLISTVVNSTKQLVNRDVDSTTFSGLALGFTNQTYANSLLQLTQIVEGIGSIIAGTV